MSSSEPNLSSQRDRNSPEDDYDANLNAVSLISKYSIQSEQFEQIKVRLLLGKIYLCSRDNVFISESSKDSYK